MERRITRMPYIPSEEEINLMINMIMNNNLYSENNKGIFLRWRDRTALVADFYGGMRPGEFLNLRWRDINFQKREIEIQPFFNKQRLGSFATLTQPFMDALIQFREACKTLGFYCEFIFPSLETLSPLTRDRWSRILLDIGKKAGIAKISWYTSSGQPKYNIKPYTGRHWYGTKVFKETQSDYATMKMLRLTDVKSIKFYAHLDNESKIDIADKVFK